MRDMRAAAESAVFRVFFTALAPGICEPAKMLSFSLCVSDERLSVCSVLHAASESVRAAQNNIPRLDIVTS